MGNIEKQELGQFKELLIEEKNRIESELKEIATPIEGKGDGWEIKSPDYGDKTADQESNADEVEEFSANLSLEKQFEERLKSIDAALQKIENNAYGICERCGQPIGVDRLKANPEARTHTKC